VSWASTFLENLFFRDRPKTFYMDRLKTRLNPDIQGQAVSQFWGQADTSKR